MLIWEMDRIIESENTRAYITEGERRQEVIAKTICLWLEQQGSMQTHQWRRISSCLLGYVSYKLGKHLPHITECTVFCYRWRKLKGQDNDKKDDIEDDLDSSSEEKSAREAIQMLESVQQFLWSWSCTHQVTQIGSIIDSVAILHSSSVVQTTLNDYILTIGKHASLANYHSTYVCFCACL